MSAQEVLQEFAGRLEPGSRKNYALAGHATITIKNPATGNRFTYRVDQKDGEKFWFVELLAGPDNETSYMYLGVIRAAGKFELTRKSRAGWDAPSVLAFGWLTHHWEDGRIEVWHDGTCGRCGRKLTVPESVASGIGPTCAGYMS